MNRYDELKKKQQEKFNSFPVAFAFSNEQLKEGMKKLGLNENDTEKITGIGAGGFIKKTDVKEYINMHKRFKQEIIEAINDRETGKEFAKDMFVSELANHEYGYTRELDETLAAVGFTLLEIDNNENLREGLALALNKYEQEEEEEENL